MRNNLRPYDNFRVALTQPRDFFGRSSLISAVQRSPFQVRILLGGRRLGKSSALNVLRASLLDSGKGESSRAFPVLFNLQQEQPKSLEHLRYLLIARLQEAMRQHKESAMSGWRKSYRRLLRQIPGGQIEIGLPKVGLKLNLTNPDHERRLIHEDFRQDLLKLLKQIQKQNFEGICFFLDGAEFIVSQDWANDAWSYLRSLKDSDIALKPFLGFLLSGYRDLKDYQQRVGSPLLNIAEVEWLGVLTQSETRALIAQRSNDEQIYLTDEQIDWVIKWAGGHPYLTQQILNTLFDEQVKDKPRSPESLMRYLIRQHDRDFSSWWQEKQRSYSFDKTEQAVYLALVKQRKGTAETLVPQTSLSLGEIADALEILAGTGVILKVDDEQYEIGARLFENWVSHQTSYR
ncbi:MAG: ATP-binding protein [Symploca sp. SIO3C6]|nr:ATP-binding protein [Symploca sp. SIO3C6]